MTLTRTQRMYLAVLGLGVVALLLDKTVLAPAPAGGEQPPGTEASDVGESGDETDHEGAAAGSVGATMGPLSVADQLHILAEARTLDPNQIADAFEPSPRWFSDARENGAKTPDEIIKEFKATYKLSGVLNNRGERMAMILDPDDKLLVLPVGETLDLFKLAAVDDRSAVFERGSIRIVLSLKTDDERKAAVRNSGGAP